MYNFIRDHKTIPIIKKLKQKRLQNSLIIKKPYPQLYIRPKSSWKYSTDNLGYELLINVLTNIPNRVF